MTYRFKQVKLALIHVEWAINEGTTSNSQATYLRRVKMLLKEVLEDEELERKNVQGRHVRKEPSCVTECPECNRIAQTWGGK